MPGIEPGASHMQSVRSTTELHPPGIVYCNTTLNVKAVQVWKIILEVPGIEPGASRMLSARSTTELHPHIQLYWNLTASTICYDGDFALNISSQLIYMIL